MNSIDETLLPTVKEVLRNTPEDFCFTLSGNPIPEECIEDLHSSVKAQHKQRVTEQRLSEPGTQVFEIADIAQRRTAF